MIEEHRAIKELVEQLNDTGEPIGLLDELSRLLKAHIRFEERELFPALEAEASRDSMREVGKALKEAHADVDLDWTPAFWE
ncbi:MAG TPA: hemerythrin domain-containing protein [Rhodothermales bacterium]|nr:hemerythrin domain-containing protein [Rhodothermales bacterium]